MMVIDADAHVLESLETFGDEYLNPAYSPRRPQAVRSGQLDYWHIDGHLFPRHSGRGCHIIGTPTGAGGVVKTADLLSLPDQAGVGGSPDYGYTSSHI